METIKGNSKNTVEAYSYDLTLFFKFMKIRKNIVPEKTDFNDIKIDDIDNYFLRTIGLNDLYAFISYTAKEKEIK